MPAKQENSESAFKNWISPQLVAKIGKSIQAIYPAFRINEFLTVQKKLQAHEMKARVRLIREKLRELLPQDYPKALRILQKSMADGSLNGFGLWPYADFIETYGLDHRELSLKALYQLTELFTSEFAIRPYLLKYPQETLRQLEQWTADKNVHVRRWVSEGTRPRLPWGLRLQFLVKDPSPTLSLLEKLKYDDELYVRKSVANHLNDISKDHPKLLVELLRKWQQKSPPEHLPKIKWIIRHALRTLIKKGDIQALDLLGFSSTAHIDTIDIKLKNKKLKVGDHLEFSFRVSCSQRKKAAKKQNLMIDYIIHHRKAGGKSSAKVFKLKIVDLPPAGIVTVIKRHSFKPVTTRRYYAGKHAIEIQINGKIYARAEFMLSHQD